jgi:hypothetical protein
MTIRDPEKILVDVALGRPPREELNEEEQAFWEALIKEIAEMRAQGKGIEIPADIP